MVLPVISYFSTPTIRPVHRPMLNSIPTSLSTRASRIGAFNSQYKTFWRKFKQSIELYGIINILVTDIVGDRPYFTAPDQTPLGRNKRLQADKHWKENRIKETLKAILFDRFVTGDGYGWKARVTQEEKLKRIKEVMKTYLSKLSSSEYNKIFIKTMQDEDLKLPKKFDYIASSTVQILSNKFDILGYRQMCQGELIDFSPEEVIHFRLNTVDGNIQGFSPMQALVKELALLYFVKGNMLAYMENGGKPDILFTLENAQPNSDTFNNFNQQLNSFVQLETSHGYLLGTGKVDVQDLSFGKSRDMEYQTLALWVTSGMLFAFGIPINRVPFLVGKSATSGDSGGMAEAGYQNMISEQQDEIEDIMNYQYFEEFGWHMHLPRHYKQDEVREAQAMSMNADTVTKLQMIYSKQKKKISVEKLNEILDISADDLEDLSPDELMQADPGLRNQNMLNNMSINKNPDAQKRADTKRNVANANVNKGLSV